MFVLAYLLAYELSKIKNLIHKILIQKALFWKFALGRWIAWAAPGLKSPMQIAIFMKASKFEINVRLCTSIQIRMKQRLTNLERETSMVHCTCLQGENNASKLWERLINLEWETTYVNNNLMWSKNPVCSLNLIILDRLTLLLSYYI